MKVVLFALAIFALPKLFLGKDERWQRHRRLAPVPCKQLIGARLVFWRRRHIRAKRDTNQNVPIGREGVAILGERRVKVRPHWIGAAIWPQV